jgi:hypothetical protein
MPALKLYSDACSIVLAHRCALLRVNTCISGHTFVECLCACVRALESFRRYQSMSIFVCLPGLQFFAQAHYFGVCSIPIAPSSAVQRRTQLSVPHDTCPLLAQEVALRAAQSGFGFVLHWILAPVLVTLPASGHCAHE